MQIADVFVQIDGWIPFLSLSSGMCVSSRFVDSCTMRTSICLNASRAQNASSESIGLPEDSQLQRALSVRTHALVLMQCIHADCNPVQRIYGCDVCLKRINILERENEKRKGHIVQASIQCPLMSPRGVLTRACVQLEDGLTSMHWQQRSLMEVRCFCFERSSVFWPTGQVPPRTDRRMQKPTYRWARMLGACACID